MVGLGLDGGCVLELVVWFGFRFECRFGEFSYEGFIAVGFCDRLLMAVGLFWFWIVVLWAGGLCGCLLAGFTWCCFGVVRMSWIFVIDFDCVW